MTSTTTTTAQDALAAAAKATAAADAAMTTARENVTAAQRKLADLEAALVAGGATSQTELAKARSAIEQARADVEWSELQLQAAEAAHSRAADADAHAHRRVVAEEYLAAHKAFNDPADRENVLFAQLTDTVAELIRLVDQRQERHHRLAQEYASFPAEERTLIIPAGKPITTYGQRGQGVWMVQVPIGDVAEAIEAGIAAARQ
jgi:hypothetical protein